MESFLAYHIDVDFRSYRLLKTLVSKRPCLSPARLGGDSRPQRSQRKDSADFEAPKIRPALHPVCDGAKKRVLASDGTDGRG
jgi:hypothetical protein